MFFYFADNYSRGEQDGGMEGKSPLFIILIKTQMYAGITLNTTHEHLSNMFFVPATKPTCPGIASGAAKSRQHCPLNITLSSFHYWIPAGIVAAHCAFCAFFPSQHVVKIHCRQAAGLKLLYCRSLELSAVVKQRFRKNCFIICGA